MPFRTIVPMSTVRVSCVLRVLVRARRDLVSAAVLEQSMEYRIHKWNDLEFDAYTKEKYW